MQNNNFNKDKELVEKLKKGSASAFSELFDVYSSKLYHFGYGYLKSKEEAEELVQEVFLKIWEKKETIKEDHPFGGYLFTIAFNYIKKYFRSKALLNKYLEMPIARSGTGETGDDTDYNWLQQHVAQLVEKMPEKRKLVFRKSRLEGKNATTIAEEMQLSQSTVENHLNLALKYLRQKLQD